LFPEHAFYDLQWTLLQLIESLAQTVDYEQYGTLISQCPSEEWRKTLNIRFNNGQKDRHVKATETARK
jgi:hypothetical protein